jgi:hypothetical protein
LFLFILVVSVVLSAYVRHRSATVAWHRQGGMIEWSQQAIEAELGPPTRVVDGDVADENARQIRRRPAGAIRSLVYQTLDGQFVARLKLEDDGRYSCFGSWWLEKGIYY